MGPSRQQIQDRPGARTTDVAYTVACVLAFGLCAVVIVAYLGLTGLGYWRDEYGLFANIRTEGGRYVIKHILGWSPRPLAELLNWLYGTAVAATRRPLIWPSLGMCWSVLLLANIVPPALYFRSSLRRFQVPSLLVAVSLICMFLLGHPVSEMFYWPQAALAYIPTIAAICLVFWVIYARRLQTLSGCITCSLSLVVAATSSEIGAIFSATFSFFLLCLMLYPLRNGQRGERFKTSVGQLSWTLIPLLCSAWVLLMLATKRAQVATELAGDASLLHRPVQSLLAAVPVFFRAIISTESGVTVRSYAVGALVKGLFFVGVCGLLAKRSAERPSEGIRLCALSAAALITIFMTIAVAFYQFGIAGMERHNTLGQCLVYVSILSLAAGLGAFPARWLFNLRLPAFAPVLALILAIAIPLIRDAPKVARDYRSYGSRLAIARENWEAGNSSGLSMTYIDPLPGYVVGGHSDLKGQYVLSVGTPWLEKCVLRFFKKETIIFIPEQ